MLKEQLKDTQGIVFPSYAQLKIESTDVVIDAGWAYIENMLDAAFMVIDYIFFHKTTTTGHSHPIQIRGFDIHGFREDVVLLGAPEDVYHRLLGAAWRAGNMKLTKTIQHAMVERFTQVAKPEPELCRVPDRLIVRKF